MDTDYYQVLGVHPNDVQAVLRTAHRNLAMIHHPDRGGSGEEMRRINEAWEVLSDPDKRHRYDELRSNPNNSEIAQAVYQDAQAAKNRADDYPKTWNEYEAWLDALAKDFSGARYGDTRSSSAQGAGVLGLPLVLPTVENSVSGCLFILVGAGIAGWFISIPIYKWINDATNHTGRFNPRSLAFIVAVAFLVGGAWLGRGIHQSIALEFAKRKTKSQNTSSPQLLAQQAPVELRIVACNKCHQKLRVPSSSDELIVTCVKCHNKFSCTPST